MPLRSERVAFVGCGTMGEAMVGGLLRETLVDAEQIVASHPRPERAELLATRHGVDVTLDNRDAVGGATIVVLTVKPQIAPAVLAEIADTVDPAALVLSIVAGVDTERIATALETPAVVRAMPNTPSQLGMGVAVWTATDAVDAAGRERAGAILSALGAVEEVASEREIDMATALSATGPAYVFLFMEALVDAGVHLGFSRRVATRLVEQTVLGSVHYAMDAPEHIAHLRNQVTSPGGTTASALYELEKGRLRTVLSDAVWAAFRRCRELGGR